MYKPYQNAAGQWVIDLPTGGRQTFDTLAEANAACKTLTQADERRQFVAEFAAGVAAMYAQQKALLIALDTYAKKGTVFAADDFASYPFSQAEFETALATCGAVLGGVPDAASAALYKIVPLKVGR